MERKKVYSPVLRFLHAWNGLAILLLILTAAVSDQFEAGAAREAIWISHILIGYALMGGLFLRLVWGFFGPTHERWKDLWHPAVWLRAIRERRPVVTEAYGHDRMASAAYLGVYAVLAFTVFTGLALAAIEHDLGPFRGIWFDEVLLEELMMELHEMGRNLIVVFTGVHLGALLWHEHKEGVPYVQSMFSGYQYGKKKEKSE